MRRYRVSFIVLTDAPLEAVLDNFQQMQGEHTTHDICSGEDVWEAHIQDTTVKEEAQ